MGSLSFHLSAVTGVKRKEEEERDEEPPSLPSSRATTPPLPRTAQWAGRGGGKPEDGFPHSRLCVRPKEEKKRPCVPVLQKRCCCFWFADTKSLLLGLFLRSKEQVKLWKVLTSVEFESISCRVFVALLEKGAKGGGGGFSIFFLPSAKVRNLVSRGFHLNASQTAPSDDPSLISIYIVYYVQ